MSTRTVRKPFYGEYLAENGPSIEGLERVNGRNRDKIPVRDKSVVFHLRRRDDDGETRVIRMTVTSVERSLTSNGRVYITGFVVASGNYGRVTMYYDTDTRTGEVEIGPLTPMTKPRVRA